MRPKRSIAGDFSYKSTVKRVRKVAGMPNLLNAEGSTVQQATKMLKNILKIVKNKPVDNVPLKFLMGRVEKVVKYFIKC